MKKFYFSVILLALLFSCKKETFITGKDAGITLSADTLRFDTIFTTTGSVTQYFKINNDNKQKLRISNVTLKGGTTSAFKMNVDGTAGTDIKDIDIAANDSLYVFVSVSLHPNSGALPFVVRDSIEISYNGNTRYVQLETWGQNANFYRATRITGNVTWKNDLPYVIIGGLQVDTNATLTIEKGCRIYLHADAPLFVDGTLKVNGEKYDSTHVYFSGDRLDYPYKDYPAGWPGIYFRGTSKNNILNYAVIRNAYQGVVAEHPSVNASPKLMLNQCIIDNMYDAGILGVQSSVQAVNCLVSNCGKNIQLVLGGRYQFNHCTVATYSSTYLSHKEPVLLVNNYVKNDNNILTDSLSAAFRNCIFWGDSIVDDEVVSSKQGNTLFSLTFQNCLWRVKTLPANADTSHIINKLDPVFDSTNAQKHYFNFTLKNNSPAVDKGINTGVTVDLNGLPRPVRLPDIGAYERQ